MYAHLLVSASKDQTPRRMRDLAWPQIVLRNHGEKDIEDPGLMKKEGMLTSNCSSRD
jgi:hypothetical protein